MRFEQALEMMRLGKKVRRSSWGRTVAFIQLDVDSIKLDTGYSMSSFSTYDLLAEDWEVVESPRTLEEVLGAFREGKKIRRRSWPYGDHTKAVEVHPQTEQFRLLITPMDMKANDWEIIDD